MAKYRKKPVVIEAFKLGVDALPSWTDKANMMLHFVPCERGEISFAEIATLEGVMRADVGDYIIQGVKGEIYPCKPDIFDLTYERVD